MLDSMNLSSYTQDFPFAQAPQIIWHYYVEYLWHYESSSWITSLISTFRVLAILPIAPMVLLGMLVCFIQTNTYHAPRLTRVSSTGYSGVCYCTHSRCRRSCQSIHKRLTHLDARTATTYLHHRHFTDSLFWLITHRRDHRHTAARARPPHSRWFRRTGHVRCIVVFQREVIGSWCLFTNYLKTGVTHSQ